MSPAAHLGPARLTLVLIWLTRVCYVAVCLTVISASLVVLGGAAYELSYRDKILPGVRAWGLDLSGMTLEEAGFALSGKFTYPTTAQFVFRAGDKTWSATPAQLGARFDLRATLSAAYSVGRPDNPFMAWLAQFDTWYFGVQVSPVVVYDEDRARAFLESIAQEVSVPTVEASLEVHETTVTTAPGQIGRQLEIDQTAAALRAQVLRLAGGEIPLTFKEIPPLILDAASQAATAQAILREPLVLSITQPLATDPGPWTIEPLALGTLLTIQRVEDGANGAHFAVGLAPDLLRVYLEAIAPQVKHQARNARFIFNDDTHQFEVVAPGEDERTLDIEASLAQIATSLAKDQHQVPLVFQTQPPEVSNSATAEQLGITELVSEQSTYFSGSSTERINNILVAAARFHGLLIPPNSTFAFDDYLGDVSLDTGFAEALIIYGGRTIRGVGGGVCQVSTTLFRAAYFGGFPIVERNSHAYRVGYYERNAPGQWNGPGLDATVFAPLVDFKFKNDLPTWLLMEVYVYPRAGRMTWKFYATGDGRQVTVAPAIVRNRVPAPDPLYEEDPALAQGEVQQVDYAAEGADVTVTRTVTRDGAVINADEAPIKTLYQPWRAIYHYGPGTEGMPPTPTPEPTPEPTPTP